jgi:hypothetical protein
MSSVEDIELDPLIAAGPSSVTSTPRSSISITFRHSSQGASSSDNDRYNPNKSTKSRKYISLSHSSRHGSSKPSRKMADYPVSKARRFLNKIAVEAEPGLTTTQLMLVNHDLKPVELERRQWGAWNFVGFWIGMCK